jgi:hypothetical protein
MSTETGLLLSGVGIGLGADDCAMSEVCRVNGRCVLSADGSCDRTRGN